jgi:hypothetical protein
MVTAHSLSAVLDAAERAGRLDVRTSELAAALPGSSLEALRQALHRQQARGRIVRVSRGSGHWVIVPLQYAASGAPPLQTWLDRYLSKSIRTPYYVGLLSAAKTYGASIRAVVATQVMVPTPRRRVTLGQHELVFHSRAEVERMPTRWHETPEGRFKVSTAELTALELVRRAPQVGGIARVREVLQSLCRACALDTLREALDAADDVPTAQRFGALMAAEGEVDLAQSAKRWLQGRKTRSIPLEAGLPLMEGASLDNVFKVWLPSGGFAMPTSETKSPHDPDD